MTDRVRGDRFGSAVTVDPERHDDDGQAQTVQSPLGDVGPEAPVEVEESKGPVVRFFESFLGMAEPKEKPTVIKLSGDEQAHRIVSDGALVALAAAFDRFVTDEAQRVETSPSEAISAEQTVVGTTARLLVGRQVDRLRVTIVNRDTGTDAVFIGTSVSVTTGDGFRVSAGESLTLDSRAPIYAISDAAATPVHLLTEFGDSA